MVETEVSSQIAALMEQRKAAAERGDWTRVAEIDGKIAQLSRSTRARAGGPIMYGSSNIMPSVSLLKVAPLQIVSKVDGASQTEVSVSLASILIPETLDFTPINVVDDNLPSPGWRILQPGKHFESLEEIPLVYGGAAAALPAPPVPGGGPAPAPGPAPAAPPPKEQMEEARDLHIETLEQLVEVRDKNLGWEGHIKNQLGRFNFGPLRGWHQARQDRKTDISNFTNELTVRRAAYQVHRDNYLVEKALTIPTVGTHVQHRKHLAMGLAQDMVEEQKILEKMEVEAKKPATTHLRACWINHPHLWFWGTTAANIAASWWFGPFAVSPFALRWAASTVGSEARLHARSGSVDTKLSEKQIEGLTWKEQADIAAGIYADRLALKREKETKAQQDALTKYYYNAFLREITQDGIDKDTLENDKRTKLQNIMGRERIRYYDEAKVIAVEDPNWKTRVKWAVVEGLGITAASSLIGWGIGHRAEVYDYLRAHSGGLLPDHVPFLSSDSVSTVVNTGADTQNVPGGSLYRFQGPDMFHDSLPDVHRNDVSDIGGRLWGEWAAEHNFPNYNPSLPQDNEHLARLVQQFGAPTQDQWNAAIQSTIKHNQGKVAEISGHQVLLHFVESASGPVSHIPTDTNFNPNAHLNDVFIPRLDSGVLATAR